MLNAFGWMAKMRQEKPIPWLNWIASIIGSFALVPLALLLIAMVVLRNLWGTPVEPLLTLIYIPHFFQSLAFADAGRYAVINGTVLIVAAAALIRGKPKPPTFWWLIACVSAVIFYPIMTGSYQPAVIATSEYRMVVPTMPVNFLESAARTAQIGAEVRPCTLENLGWDAADRFYYRSVCGQTVNVWSIDPESETKPRREASSPDELGSTPLTRGNVLTYLRRPNTDDTMLDQTWSMYVAEEQSQLSPDERWLAVISQHLYGPQDVLLIEIDKE